jgi:hypothetical protein
MDVLRIAESAGLVTCETGCPVLAIVAALTSFQWNLGSRRCLCAKIHRWSNTASNAAWVFSMTERNSSRLIFRIAMMTAGSIRAVSDR